MSSYVGYNFYSGVYGGEISSVDFFSYEFRARKFIDKITFNRITEEILNDDIRMAMCIAIDKIKKADEERTFKTSESVGKHSVSYSENLMINFEKDLYKEISSYIPSYLLYRGCD
ncbi:hypothetical protein ACSXAY_02545 [Clostridium perfringens]